MNRRGFMGAGGVALTGLFGLGAADPGVDLMESFDREVERFMELRGVPGASLAVVKDRRLVYARGYGWADREGKVRATAESRYRIASLSKPITGVAVLKLVEEGRVALGDRLFDAIDRDLLKGAGGDSRLGEVTVEQALKHTGGWNRDRSFDPMFRCREIAGSLKVGCPPGPWDVIRYMVGQRLDFDPGTEYAYSNFGYCLLGRLIERVTGMSYEEHVRERLLKGIGAERMRIGSTRIGGRLAGEVRYYVSDGKKVRSLFGEGGDEVPVPYGGFHLEAMDAHGGWVGSVTDLARFAAALDDEKRSPLLREGTFRDLYAPPAAPVSRTPEGSPARSYYGCGWSVRPRGEAGRPNYWHTGSLPGTAALLVRRGDGLSWVILFNQRSADPDLPDSAIDPALHRAAAAVKAWPAGVALL